MVQALSLSLTVSSRRKTELLNTAKRISLRERLRSYIASSAPSISLICIAWSSRVHKRCTAVTIYLVDQDWNIGNTILGFICFETPHTAEASYSVLLDAIKAWNQETLVHSITTDKATDIVKEVELLRKHSLRNVCHGVTPLSWAFSRQVLCARLQLSTKRMHGAH